MTIDEARRLLGVEAGADERTVRRAYLAAVKTHKPERDPEGFQRVREAYELVRRWFPARVYVAPATAADAAPIELPPAERPPMALRADPLQPFVERAQQTEDPAEWTRIAREAAAALGTADAYSWLLDTIDNSGDEERATLAVLREAIERGHGATFLPELAARFPRELDEAELAVIRERVERGDGGNFMQLANVYLARDRAADAAGLAIAALEHARREPFSPRPQRWWVSNLALQLLERQQIEAARRVLELERAVFEGSDERPGASAIAQREMTHELAAVAAALPAEVLQGLARSLREHEPVHAESALELHWQRHKRSAHKLAVLLKHEAPLLREAYGHSLAGRTAEARDARSLRPARPWHAQGGLYLAGLLLVRFLYQADMCHERHSPLSYDSAQAMVERAKAELAARSASEQPAWLTELCPHWEQDSALCSAGQQLKSAKSCAGMFTALDELDSAARADYAASLPLTAGQNTVLAELHRRVASVCGASPAASADGGSP